MPLTLRERRAVWHARQHYFSAFVDLLDASLADATTPALVQHALTQTLRTIRDRIDAENPDLPPEVLATPDVTQSFGAQP